MPKTITIGTDHDGIAVTWTPSASRQNKIDDDDSWTIDVVDGQEDIEIPF